MGSRWTCMSTRTCTRGIRSEAAGRRTKRIAGFSPLLACLARCATLFRITPRPAVSVAAPRRRLELAAHRGCGLPVRREGRRHSVLVPRALPHSIAGGPELRRPQPPRQHKRVTPRAAPWRRMRVTEERAAGAKGYGMGHPVADGCLQPRTTHIHHSFVKRFGHLPDTAETARQSGKIWNLAGGSRHPSAHPPHTTQSADEVVIVVGVGSVLGG